MDIRCATLTGLALLFLTTLATAATVQDLMREPMKIEFPASDLQTLAGIGKLYGRIESAAKWVCHEPPMGELARYMAFRHCVDLAVRDAVEQVHSPALTAFHHRKERGAAG